MLRSHQEIEGIAKGIVNRFVAEMMFEFPKISKAVGVNNKKWAEFLDEREKELEEILITKFGTCD